jgi:DNA-binding NarL/FixJ family response regulator
MWKLGRVSTAPASMPDWYRWIIEGESDRAAAFWGAQGATYDRAVALLHGDDAQTLEALRIVEDLAADGTARRFRRVLRRRGLHAPRGSSRASRAHPAGLTARQAEVMQLLADGLSNVEIADTLFVSHRTVENHVAAILRKLNVTSRHAAVETARSQGLLDIG